MIGGEEEDEDRRRHDRRTRGDDVSRNRAAEEKPGPKQVASLFQGIGTHYVDLWCGTPAPQRQTVIVDTGSGVTAFPCSPGCRDSDPGSDPYRQQYNRDGTYCGTPEYHIDSLFDTARSATYHLLDCNECLNGQCEGGSHSCRMHMSYQEGSSWSAVEVQDNCYIGGMHDVVVTTEQENVDRDNDNVDDLDPFDAASFAFPLKFGCQDHLTGLFIDQLADGIMGMDNARNAFWAQMSDQLGVERRFSLCFSRSPIASRNGTNAGAMTMGGTDERFHQSPMVYTDVEPGNGAFYTVHVNNIFLKRSEELPDTKENLVSLFTGDQHFNYGMKAIVDSGTTDTYFEGSLASSFNKAWYDMVGSTFTHNAQKLTDEELNNLPTIVFQIAGNKPLNQGQVELAGGVVDDVPNLVGLDLDDRNPLDILVYMPPQHYMEYRADEDSYTAEFYLEEGSGRSVMGANFMMGHDVFFDVDNNVIGWAQSDCDYEGLVQPFVEKGALTPNDNSKATIDKATQQAGDGDNKDDTIKPEEGSVEKTNDQPGDDENKQDNTEPEEESVNKAGQQSGDEDGTQDTVEPEEKSADNAEQPPGDEDNMKDTVEPEEESVDKSEQQSGDEDNKQDTVEPETSGISQDSSTSGMTDGGSSGVGYCDENDCKMMAVFAIAICGLLLILALIVRRKRRFSQYIATAASELELQETRPQSRSSSNNKAASQYTIEDDHYMGEEQYRDAEGGSAARGVFS